MSAAPAPVPSILDLGRHIRILGGKVERIEDARQARPAAAIGRMLDQAEQLYSERREAFIDIIATHPAQTLGDAAAQLAAAWEYHCLLEDFELSEQETKEVITKLRRITLSVLPQVVEAAGLKPLDLVGEEIGELRAAEFGGLERAA